MKRITLSILLASFVTASYAATPASNNNISPAEKAKIESVVHQYLVSHPEVLVEAMQALQQKQFAEAQQAVKQTQKIASSYAKALFQHPNDPVRGNPNGAVTIVEFFDYQCPHCIDMVPTMDAIVKANPDVRIIYKEFPIRGPVSEFAARAALAANLQGKYNEFSHALLGTKQQPLTQESIFQIAKTTGLNVDKLKQDMNSKAINDQLQANMKLAQDLKLFGTPALFIGKTKAASGDAINYIPGQTDVSQLQALINQSKS